MDNTYRQVNRCSYEPTREVANAQKYYHNFVCEKEDSITKDITPVVQGLYKTTVNQYSYKEAY
jgi:hypothetical protein